MTGRDRQIRLGVLGANPSQLRQIEAWAAGFNKVNAHIEPLTEIGLEPYDLYLIVLDPAISERDTKGVSELGALITQAASTPCLVIATRDDEPLVEAALAAGAADFLAMPNTDAVRLERAIRFSLGQRRWLDGRTARESCLMAAHERYHQQLANMLHDGPLQDLIGARFLVGALGSEGATSEIQNSLQTVIQTVRSLCSELKPPALGPFGLGKAMRAYMQSFEARNPDITKTLELDVDNQQLPEWAQLALFRVFQAAVSNVAIHAQASQIGLRLSLGDEQLRLTVADDGQGFVVPSSWLEFARTERYGLLAMQERVDALQGRMMVQSTPGGGTRVMVQVPLDQPPLPLPAHLITAIPDRNG